MKLKQLALAFALVVCAGSIARAELVTFILNLDTPSAAANRLNLSLLGGTTTSDLTGTMTAQVEVNRATGIISTWELLFNPVPSIASSNWTLNAVGVGAVTGTNIGASMDTTVAASSVTGGTVPAAEQEIRLISGTVTAATVPITTINIDSTDGGDVNIPGAAPVTLTSTLNAGLGGYEVVFTMPIDNIQQVAGAPLSIMGTVLARGQIAVPEPSCALLLLVTGSAFAFRRRRGSLPTKTSR